VEKALPIERGNLASLRRFLGTAGAATLALAPLRALADSMVTLPLPGGPDERQITTAFPEKGALILQRTRPPLLETPLDRPDQISAGGPRSCQSKPSAAIVDYLADMKIAR
jgi:hypothetical protein